MAALGANARRAPCAVCTKRDRYCPRHCEFSQYFPAATLNDYNDADKLFGTSNIMKMMRLAYGEHQKRILATSILAEGVAWKQDPVRGAFGMLQRMMWKIKLSNDYLEELKKIKKEYEENNNNRS